MKTTSKGSKLIVYYYFIQCSKGADKSTRTWKAGERLLSLQELLTQQLFQLDFRAS